MSWKRAGMRALPEYQALALRILEAYEADRICGVWTLT